MTIDQISNLLLTVGVVAMIAAVGIAAKQRPTRRHE